LISKSDGLRALTLLLSGQCNLACRYCYQGARRGSKRMSWAVARAALDFVTAHSTPPLIVEFSGGEPLLEAGLLRRCIEYLGSRSPETPSPRLVLTTNGLLLDEGLIAFLSDHGVDLNISFDGPPEAQKVRARRTFERLDGLLTQIRSGHPAYWRDRVTICVVLVPETVPMMAQIAAYLLGKGSCAVAFSPVIGAEDRWGGDLEASLMEQVARIVRMVHENGVAPQTVPVLFLRDGRPSAPHGTFLCGAGYGKGLCVDAGGAVWTCPLFASSLQMLPPLAREVSRATRLGHIGDGDLGERLTALPEKTTRLPLLTGREEKHSGRGRCMDCQFQEECFVCPAAVSHAPGADDPHRVPDFQCAFARATSGARRAFQSAFGNDAPRRKSYLLA
jgi:MoaA/NifB/PqqE/SkfB family radical SAM enzyme